MIRSKIATHLQITEKQSSVIRVKKKLTIRRTCESNLWQEACGCQAIRDWTEIPRRFFAVLSVVLTARARVVEKVV